MAQELRRGGGGSGFSWAFALSLPSLFLGPDLLRVAPSLNRLPFEVPSTLTCWAARSRDTLGVERPGYPGGGLSRYPGGGKARVPLGWFLRETALA